jgi:pimeloyl-ACP methyl ester carboxylesterase
MGGMTVMALAEQRPELFGDKVVAVALMSTSSGKLADVTLGLPALAGRVVNRFRPHLMDQVSRRAELVERGRRASSDLAYVLTKKFSFGSDVPPDVVRFAQRIIESTPADVVAEFYPALHSHDKLAALPVLDKVEAMVLVGDRDLLTPADHSRDIAREIPGCELVTVSDGGHLVFVEHAEVVTGHLRGLLERAVARTRPGEGPGR